MASKKSTIKEEKGYEFEGVRVLPTSDFPLLKKYTDKFALTLSEVAFPYDNKIYTDSTVTPEIVVHEKVHFAQQKEHGLDNWIEQYFENPQFRVNMEIEAYNAQLKYVVEHAPREAKTFVANVVAGQMAKALSSPMYGNIFTYKEALSKIHL